MLEKAQLEKFNEMSACYDKYESILGQVLLRNNGICDEILRHLDSFGNV
jgi:hypothetical protein